MPASDKALREEVLPKAEKALKATIKLETITANDLQARITAAIEGSAGPDIIMTQPNWQHLYEKGVVDVSDVAEKIGKAQGGFSRQSRDVATSGGKFIAVPWSVVGLMVAYRKPWFAEEGVTKFPATWEEYRTVGKKLKANSFPSPPPASCRRGIFAFTLSWNEFIYALAFLSTTQQKTVPVGVVSELIRGDVFFWGPLMAGALLGSIPVTFVYAFFVEHYVAGMTGSVKG